MKVIGLTGGIGSGKSTVLSMFQKLGAVTYIADIEAKKLMNTNEELIDKISQLFGKKAYLYNELNKKYIASIVFNDQQKLAELNELVHPKVRDHFNKFLKKTTAKIVIYESAILFESDNNKRCDFIITVTANFEDKLKRVMKRDGVTKQQIFNRIKNQLPDDIKIINSNFVINNCTINDTKLQVLTIYDLISRS
ncbi:MAG: dephospho-CoA kinase [Lutibacter sp.]|uniref:dephospho-CoA kinase n=1 Tax=Lutibacter sp. TaxID=1925666 RepID=UPI00385BA779